MRDKHFLLYGHGGCYNHGVEAITGCTMAYLRRKYPSCFITLSSHFPEQDKEFGLCPDEFVARNMQGEDNREVYQSTLDRIKPDTTVIHLGGDNYCYRNWQRYALIHEEAKKIGAKSILWGCSIDEEVINKEMEEVLRTHDLILARDAVTYRTLCGMGLTNVEKVSDIAFCLEPQKRDKGVLNVNYLQEMDEETCLKSSYVVLNVSPLVCRRNQEVKEGFFKLRDYILEHSNLNILLLPHVVMSADNDYDVLQELMPSGSNRIFLASDRLHAAEYKYLVSRARLCVAARTHVTIAAYSSLVPTLAVGYSTKARGIAEDLGMERYVLDILREDFSSQLQEAYAEMAEDEETIRKQLSDRIPQYKENTEVQLL